MTWGIMVENNTDIQSVFIQQLSVPVEDLCDFLKSLEDVDKKIIIHVNGTITFKIREDIESVVSEAEKRFKMKGRYSEKLKAAGYGPGWWIH